MQELQQIPIDKLCDHPNNPRLVQREEVIESIASHIKEVGTFDPAHALLVRPMGNKYQIVMGHHRRRAAERAGLEFVPCWVRNMGDDEAYMMLGTSNEQSDMTPLEWGMHALGYVQMSKVGAGRGNTGGVSEYARVVGRHRGHMIAYVGAAHVVKVLIGNDPLRDHFTESDLLDKAKHLYEISKLDQSLWATAASRMLRHQWSAADTAHWCKSIAEFDIPERWQEVFLPLSKVVDHYLSTHEFSPQTVTKLVKLAESVVATIDAYTGHVTTAEHQQAFANWLKQNMGSDSWDVRQIIKYQKEIQSKLESELFEASSMWNLGSWRDYVGNLDDGSVSLVLTDPPYGMEYQSDYKLDRREERKHEYIKNDDASATDEIQQCLQDLHAKLKADAHVFCFCHWRNEEDIRQAIRNAGYTIRGSLIWVKNNTGMGDPNTTFAPKHERIIHAVKGSPVLFERCADVLMADRESSELHPTQKPTDLLKRLIEVSTVVGEVVADPFGGVASTLVAAKELDRSYWGCEIEPVYHSSGKERLAALRG